jgi:pimeloyl-ACP methyl ester carboxylesterase
VPGATPAPAPIVERTLQVGAVRTRALEVAGSGPLHVLLHGYADSAETWHQVMERMARRGRAAVALDLPGFAHADPLIDEEPVLAQLAGFTRAAALALASRGRGVVLVGNSLGGISALLAAQGMGDPLKGVVAVAPAGFDMGQWIYRVQTFSLLQTLLRLPPTVPARVVRPMVGLIYRQLAIHDQRMVAGHLVGTFASHISDRETILRYLRVARRLPPELSEPFELDAIGVPVLVIWGRQDRMLPHRNSELLLAAVPHAQLETIDPCGHCPQVERAALTTELMLSFAERL